MLLVHPPKLVTVQRDGRWFDGQLRAWHRDSDGWHANVTYTVQPGHQYLDWVSAERVQER